MLPLRCVGTAAPLIPFQLPTARPPRQPEIAGEKPEVAPCSPGCREAPEVPSHDDKERKKDRLIYHPASFT